MHFAKSGFAAIEYDGGLGHEDRRLFFPFFTHIEYSLAMTKTAASARSQGAVRPRSGRVICLHSKSTKMSNRSMDSAAVFHLVIRDQLSWQMTVRKALRNRKLVIVDVSITTGKSWASHGARFTSILIPSNGRSMADLSDMS